MQIQVDKGLSLPRTKAAEGLSLMPMMTMIVLPSSASWLLNFHWKRQVSFTFPSIFLDIVYAAIQEPKTFAIELISVSISLISWGIQEADQVLAGALWCIKRDAYTQDPLTDFKLFRGEISLISLWQMGVKVGDADQRLTCTERPRPSLWLNNFHRPPHSASLHFMSHSFPTHTRVPPHTLHMHKGECARVYVAGISNGDSLLLPRVVHFPRWPKKKNKYSRIK